uniref:CCAAT-binding factor domain-containing protein n=1 Tax=Picocystis salinarum TaxID=88271 RepID=A0A7S3XGK9_9CHLO|eukprot:CAMPEP_0183827816 /NCGR_PEP_ID=MMETSP0807_2-20130328/2447_1 /TAXON_ID=88271 /ORGANISM="Picocystis salinarum, Strain CCMP1897" /LENGTH=446 /DNA_ID=CAMNT_0026072989 /DNA_START=1 /DNA_END=1341 /DNA_ORIENTATION=+
MAARSRVATSNLATKLRQCCASGGRFDEGTYEELLLSILREEERERRCDSLASLADEATKFLDVRACTWKICANLLHKMQKKGKKKRERMVKQVGLVLLVLPAKFEDGTKGKRKALADTLPDAEKNAKEGRDSWWRKKSKQKLWFSRAWTELLLGGTPDTAVLKLVLPRLRDDVLPNLQEPLMLSNLLLDLTDVGGATGARSLGALLDLVQQHGLECPRVYDKVYRLLDQKRFASLFPRSGKGEGPILLSRLLSSTHVPAYVAAAYAKRMARRATRAGPPSAIGGLALAFNALRRHAACSIMLQRAQLGTGRTVPLPAARSSLGDSSQTGSPDEGKDPFCDDQEDPANAHALESAFWEVGLLQRKHYNPQVRAFATLFDVEEASLRSRTRDVDVEPLAQASYTSMIRESARRPAKKLQMDYVEEVPNFLFGTQKDANCFPGWTWAQ